MDSQSNITEAKGMHIKNPNWTDAFEFRDSKHIRLRISNKIQTNENFKIQTSSFFPFLIFSVAKYNPTVKNKLVTEQQNRTKENNFSRPSPKTLTQGSEFTLTYYKSVKKLVDLKP